MPNIVLYGPNGSPLAPLVPMGVDATHMAARVALRPLDHATQGQVLGHYKLAFTFSNAANITTTPLVTLRWAPTTTAFFVLHRLRWLAANLTTAFTTQQLVDVAATIARMFSAADTGGSSSIIPLSAANKSRSTMGGSLLNSGGQLITGSTAIAAGTRTLDANPFAYASGDIASNTAATGGTPLVTSPKDLYVYQPGSEHPPVLAQNEGIVINCPNSLAAVGVVKWGFVMEWAEVMLF